MKYFVTGPSGHEYEIDIREGADGSLRLHLAGGTIMADFREIARHDATDGTAHHLGSLILGGRSHDVALIRGEDRFEVMMDGRLFPFRVVDETQKRLEASGGGRKKRPGPPVIKAEMPGLVVAIKVVCGQQVAKGDVLLVVEAMKMQNEIVAPASAVVTEIPVKPGDVLAGGAVLVRLEYGS